MASQSPDWNDIRDVLLIHEAGSISAAARLAGVSQSTMSRRLAAIEAEGNRAFARGPAGTLSLTERGQVMVRAGRLMRTAYKANMTELDGRAPPLRIAACEVTAQLFMADALPVWQRDRGSAADVSIYEDLFCLKPTDFDLLVMPTDSVPPDLKGVEIGGIRWGLYAAPSYLARRPVRNDAGSLADHQVILASGSLSRIGVYQWLSEQGGQAILYSSSPIAQREACARGQGVALLPCDLVGDDPRLEPLPLPVPAGSPVWILADAQEASQKRIAAFLRWARRHFAEACAGRLASGRKQAGIGPR